MCSILRHTRILTKFNNCRWKTERTGFVPSSQAHTSIIVSRKSRIPPSFTKNSSCFPWRTMSGQFLRWSMVLSPASGRSCFRASNENLRTKSKWHSSPGKTFSLVVKHLCTLLKTTSCLGMWLNTRPTIMARTHLRARLSTWRKTMWEATTLPFLFLKGSLGPEFRAAKTLLPHDIHSRASARSLGQFSTVTMTHSSRI